MKPENAKHTLAILRIALGWPQKEMADRLGVAYSTVSSIETNRLKLSKNIAIRASKEIGVDPEWLFANDLSRPLKWAWLDPESEACLDPEGETKFRRILLDKPWPAWGPGMVREFWMGVCMTVAVLDSAAHSGKQKLFFFKLQEAATELALDFGYNQELFRKLVKAGQIKIEQKTKLFRVLPVEQISKAVSSILLRKAKSK